MTRIPQNPAKVKPKLHEKSTQGGQNSTKVNKHRLKCDMNGKTLKTRKMGWNKIDFLFFGDFGDIV